MLASASSYQLTQVLLLPLTKFRSRLVVGCDLLLRLPRQHILARWRDRLLPVAVTAYKRISRASSGRDGDQEQHRYRFVRHVGCPLIAAMLFRVPRGVFLPMPTFRRHSP